MNYGTSSLLSSFRGELPERGRGDAAGVSFPKLFGDNGRWSMRGSPSRAVTTAGARSGGTTLFLILTTWRTVPCALPLTHPDRAMPP